MVIQPTTLRAQLNTISTSTDPAAAHVECFIEEVTATSSRPAHSAINLINSELPPLVAAGKNPEYKMIMSPAEAAALTAAQQPQPRRADDRSGDDVALAVQRTSAENLPLGAGGAPWQGE